MTRWLALLIAPAVVLLAGCVDLYALIPEQSGQIERWVAEEEYGKALKSLARISPSQPDYASLQARRQEIERLAARLETTIIRGAAALTRRQQWQEALDLYDEGLRKLPASERLSEARAAFLEKRMSYVQELAVKSALSRAEWLVQVLPVQRRITETIPEDKQAQRDLEELEDDVRRTGAELYACGQHALERRQDALAVRCLGLAEKLTPSASVRRALASAEAREAQQRDRERRAKYKRREQIVAEKEQALLDRYDAAFGGGDLQEARKALDELKTLKPRSPDIGPLEAQLAAAIADTVDKGMEASRRLYSQGKFVEALASWRALSALDPENEELKTHIARAERVLAKLRSLNEKQPDGAPVSGESAEP